MVTIRSSLTPPLTSPLPTETDIEFFEDHGWFISDRIIPDDVIELALVGRDRLYRGERDQNFADLTQFSNWNSEDGDRLRNDEFVARQIQEFQPLVFYPLLGEIAARLLRSSGIRLFEEQLLTKPPQTPGTVNAIGWHTDLSFCSFSTTEKMIACWIPLQDCTIEMGPLVVLDRSHKWTEYRSLRQFQSQDLDSFTQELEAHGKLVKPVPMAIKRGQVSFHHGWTIHGSYPNHSSQNRVVVAVHLQDANNKFKLVNSPKGEPYRHHLDQFCETLPNGNPDYQDSKIYPIIWEEI
jgi:Phytanoyl-CoA dioxygenase (PhyH)